MASEHEVTLKIRSDDGAFREFAEYCGNFVPSPVTQPPPPAPPLPEAEFQFLQARIDGSPLEASPIGTATALQHVVEGRNADGTPKETVEPGEAEAAAEGGYTEEELNGLTKNELEGIAADLGA